MTWKTSFLAALLLMTFEGKGAEVCNLDYKSYNLTSSKDCITCTGEIKSPGDRADSTMSPLVNFFTKEEEQKATIRKLKVLDHFLKLKEVPKRCSNYKSLVEEFTSEFHGYVSACEKGPEYQKSLICEWVLPTYNQKIIDSLYSYWMEYDKKGRPVLIPGRYKEHLEIPIRAQEAWCRKVEKNYNKRIFLSCGELRDWVSEFDVTKRVSDAMKRDMAERSMQVDVAVDRTKALQDACKYFDKNRATNFTRLLYLKCLTE